MTAAKATNTKTPAKPKAKTPAPEATGDTSAETQATPSPAPKAEPKKKATPAKPPEEEGIPALWIKAKSGSIRRCGHRFDETGFGIALTALSDEEVEIFSNDPDLIVEEVTGV